MYLELLYTKVFFITFDVIIIGNSAFFFFFLSAKFKSSIELRAQIVFVEWTGVKYSEIYRACDRNYSH